MRVYFAGDHAGFELKGKLIAFVKGLGHEVEDLGPHGYEPGDDYTDYVIPLAKRVAKAQTDADHTQTDAEATPLTPPFERGEGEGTSPPFLRRGMMGGDEVRGIVVAGSGQGEIIAMNRIPGVRAALLCGCNLELIKASRDHNDSNILAIGARFASEEEAKRAIQLWLETPFSGEERHMRRLRKIEKMTGEQYTVIY